MINLGGSLGGRPWVGWVAERPEDLGAFREWVSRQALSSTVVCYDLETTGKGAKLYQDPNFIRLAQFGNEDEAWVIPVEHGAAFAEAVRYALSTLPSLVGHNSISFDGIASAVHLGFDLDDYCARMTDTLNTSKLIDPRSEKHGGPSHSLKGQSEIFIDPNAPDTQEDLHQVFKDLKIGHTKSNGLGWSAVPWSHPTYLEYAALDTILGSRLHSEHLRELDRLGVRRALVPYETELSRIAAHMAMAGMEIDVPYTQGLYGTLDGTYNEWMEVANRHDVLSADNSEQVVAGLLAMGERLRKLTNSGKNFSVGSDVLMPIAGLNDDWERVSDGGPGQELAEAVLRAKRAGKWKTTYVDRFLSSLDEHGLIHPNIQTLEARTGRMSITQPAVQTLPSGDWMIRRCITAPEGWRTISVDFKAVELRVLAALANVRRMREAIAAGEDLHGFTSEMVYGDRTPKHRKLCKRIGLGKVYGAGLETLVAQTGAPIDQVKYTKDQFERLYPEIARSDKRWRREARASGYAVFTETGRRLPVDAHRMFTVVNLHCQSIGRDVLGKALINMSRAGLLPYLRLPIHDEALAMAPEGEAREVAREIERCMTFDLKGVPIDADAELGGRTWGSLYMKTPAEKLDAPLAIEHDPYWAAHPDEAYAAAA